MRFRLPVDRSTNSAIIVGGFIIMGNLLASIDDTTGSEILVVPADARP
ncbi:hypothetical protein APR04_000009 [Promicromonospora umidemergens]|nr:hypothetical protein [Promicromonospora umidemergens]